MTVGAASAAPVDRAAVPVAPVAVRVLCWLLVATAAATAAVEVLNWRFGPESGFGLAVRTSWALVRSLGFLVLVWHVRAGRPGARPFGLILSITTIFAVGRLIVPSEGWPPALGGAGFGLLVALCALVVLMLYRSPTVLGWLARPRTRLVLGRGGFARRPVSPRSVSGRLLAARVAALTLGPLVMVPALVAIGESVGGRLGTLPLSILWLVGGFLLVYLLLPVTFFLLRGQGWARLVLVGVTAVVLVVDLGLCALLLGVDGLIRDGGPLLVAGVLAVWGSWPRGEVPVEPSRP